MWSGTIDELWCTHGLADRHIRRVKPVTCITGQCVECVYCTYCLRCNPSLICRKKRAAMPSCFRAFVRQEAMTKKRIANPLIRACTTSKAA